MAYSSITKPSDYFSTKLYTGNGGTQAITGVGHQPDWTWIKRRDSSVADHSLHDVVRGSTNRLESNTTNAESSQANSITSFNTDGFTLGNYATVNGSGNIFASWNWKAGAGQGSSNTDGSINTTYTSVNTTAGFSISGYTGTGSNATVGHGLGAIPKMIIFKVRDGATAWVVYHKNVGPTKGLFLNTNGTGSTVSAYFQDTNPTSSVFSVGSDADTNGSSKSMITYCFAEKTGFNKFGSYIGNGDANGTFVYTGFKPAFVMLKNTTTAASWLMYDNKRLGYNVDNNELVANTADDEETYDQIDILSNGFKMRANGTSTNKSGDTFIYMAFAENPFVASNYNVATAR